MKVGKIEFGPCTESIKIKNKEIIKDTMIEELEDRPDYVIPNFSKRRDKLSKKLDATQSKILSQPYKKDHGEPEVVQGSESYDDLFKNNTQKQNALSRQVGGSHYKQYKIQPYEFFIANQTPHHKAAIIRRILRYDHPTGKGLEDLKKIMHEVELIIQLENWEGKCGKPTAKKEG